MWVNGVIYGSGGGGGGNSNFSGQIGYPGIGSNGGGNGGYKSPVITPATTGSANTGAGGGGGASAFPGGANIPAYAGKDGGSGVVIIRYLGSQRAYGGNVSTSGSYTYHTFTSGSWFSA